MPKNKIVKYTADRGQVCINVATNQKVVEIRKVNNKRGKILDIAANKQAMKDLSLAAYTLYMHFVLNMPGYQEALSVKNLTENSGLSTKTYYKAVNELIEKNYLVRDETNTQFEKYYVFYEDPSLSPKSDESLDEV